VRGDGDGESGAPGRSAPGERGAPGDGDADACTSMLVAMFDWPSRLYWIVTCRPVDVARPAASLDEPEILVESSYLNFISDPATVFTVRVLLFASTSVSSPVAVVAAWDCPSPGDAGDAGVDGDGGWPAGGRA
jgi:hypothetical protein